MEKKAVKNTNVISTESKNVFQFLLLVVGEALLLLFLFLITIFQDVGLDIITWFHNPVSECSVYGTTLLVLFITGLFPDFLRAFVYTLKKQEEITVIQVKKSLLAVKLAMITAVVSQLFVLVFCYVSMLRDMHGTLSDQVLFPTTLALYGGCAIYGILAVLMLLPVYARLKVRLISMEQPVD